MAEIDELLKALAGRRELTIRDLNASVSNLTVQESPESSRNRDKSDRKVNDLVDAIQSERRESKRFRDISLDQLKSAKARGEQSRVDKGFLGDRSLLGKALGGPFNTITDLVKSNLGEIRDRFDARRDRIIDNIRRPTEKPDEIQETSINKLITTTTASGKVVEDGLRGVTRITEAQGDFQKDFSIDSMRMSNVTEERNRDEFNRLVDTLDSGFDRLGDRMEAIFLGSGGLSDSFTDMGDRISGGARIGGRATQLLSRATTRRGGDEGGGGPGLLSLL